MVIGIDIRVLARGTRTGIEEYTLNLLSRLLSLDKSIKFKLFYNAFNKVGLNYDWANLPNVEIKKFNYPNRFVFDPLAKFLRLPKIDKMLGGVDVFFAPHFLLSPVSKDCRRIITFHDLSFEYFPEFLPWRKRFWHAFLNPRRRALQADKIIAVSGSTKNDLVDLYGLPSEKIKLIYSGVGEEFKKFPISNFQFPNIRKKYGLPEKFILYFGTIEPRKNLLGLIRAYEIFREKYKIDDFKLVVAGSRGWLDKEIISAANNSKYHQDIIFTGFVAPSDKIYLYNLASLFVYPSFFEGFGFPPLEAMSCGVPVICSYTSSFPEVVGEAALMVDPYNFEEIAWAMKEVLTDQNLRDDLISKGIEHIKKFSWDRCARETLEFLIS
ncbi:MAG: Glycosyl transferase group 1 [Parcubacteria group bacterium LiPW_39]|nr:MAG: Glycosyl transferase group 1 [Parcubacteria group bacterium LiPW_39]